MAGKQISAEQLTEAVKAYCTAEGKQSSQSEEKPNKITIFSGTPEPGDPMMWLEDGLFRCSDTEFGMRFMEEYLTQPEAPRQTPNNGKGIVPTNGRKPFNGVNTSLPAQIRDVQVSDLTLDDIKAYICPTATDQEAFMFLKLCQARNLNPFVKECYLIKYASGGPATMVVGKDAFCRRAEEHPQFDGYKAGIIIETDGKLDYREGTFMLKNENLVGAWSEVYRRDRSQPFKNTVSRAEYDTGKSNWQKMPATMLRKVSLVQCLREAFASEFSGMYDQAEMGIDPAREVSA